MMGLLINQFSRLTLFFVAERVTAGWNLLPALAALSVALAGDIIFRLRAGKALGKTGMATLILLSIVSNVAACVTAIGYADSTNPTLMQNMKNDARGLEEIAQERDVVLISVIVVALCETATWLLFLRARLTEIQ